MPELSLRTVRISLAIMTLAGYLALVTTDMFGPEIAIVPLVLVACMRYFERLDAHSKTYRRLSQIVTLAFIIVIVPYLFLQLILGLTAVILFIQIYLFLHGKGVKEYRYLFLMAFFLLVDAVAQSPDSGFGLVMPIFIISAVWAFASVQIYAEAEANRRGNIADLLPSIYRRGFLPPEVAQWVAGEQRDKMSVAPLLTGVSLGCVVVTLLFFLFTPRLEAGVFGRSNVTPQMLRAGLDDRVNLSAGGNIAADEAPVFLVRFPREPAGTQPMMGVPLYWRVTSFNRLVGAEWDRVSADFEFIEWQSRGGRIERLTPNSGRKVIQEIFLQDTHGLPGIPALPGLYRLVPAPTARFDLDQTENLTWHVVETTSQSVSYRAESRLPEFSRDRLVAATSNYSRGFDSEILMQKLTDNRLSQQAKSLARSLTGGIESPYEKAEAIQRYLKDSGTFAYTTSLEALSFVDPIDSFLFETRRGHCELFASCMCMMLRSVGVPARVVSGFRDGDWSPADDAYIVRRRHAHLWVEVYLNQIGWTTFDPSGEAEIDNSMLAAFKRAVGRYSLMAKFVYYRDVIGYRSGIQLQNLVTFSVGLFYFDVDLMRNSLPPIRYFARGLPAMLIGLCVSVAVIWGFFLMYRSASLKRRTGPAITYSPDQIRATRVYARLRRRLLALGTNGPCASARELVREVENNTALDAGAVSRIVQAYNDSRFGGRPMGRDRYQDLVRAVGSLKRARQSR
jgi:transglutaminase-like putative cysteine protease